MAYHKMYTIIYNILWQLFYTLVNYGKVDGLCYASFEKICHDYN